MTYIPVQALQWFIHSSSNWGIYGRLVFDVILLWSQIRVVRNLKSFKKSNLLKYINEEFYVSALKLEGLTQIHYYLSLIFLQCAQALGWEFLAWSKVFHMRETISANLRRLCCLKNSPMYVLQFFVNKVMREIKRNMGNYSTKKRLNVV